MKNLIIFALFLSSCTSIAQPAQLEIKHAAPLPKPRKACIENIYTEKIRRCDSAAIAPFVYPHCEQLTPDKFAQTGWGGRKNKRRYAAALKSIISRYNLEKL